MKATEKAESQNEAEEDGECPNAKNKHSLKFSTPTNRSGVFLTDKQLIFDLIHIDFISVLRNK